MILRIYQQYSLYEYEYFTEMADQLIFLQSINMPESQFWESDNRQPVGAAGCLDKNLDPSVGAAGCLDKNLDPSVEAAGH